MPTPQPRAHGLTPEHVAVAPTLPIPIPRDESRDTRAVPHIQQFESYADEDFTIPALELRRAVQSGLPLPYYLLSNFDPSLASMDELRKILDSNKVRFADVRPLTGSGSCSKSELVEHFNHHIKTQATAAFVELHYPANASEDTTAHQNQTVTQRYTWLRDAILAAPDLAAAHRIAWNFRTKLRQENHDLATFDQETVRIDLETDEVIIDWEKPQEFGSGTTVKMSNEIDARTMANRLLTEYEQILGGEASQDSPGTENMEYVETWEDKYEVMFGRHYF